MKRMNKLLMAFIMITVFLCIFGEDTKALAAEELLAEFQFNSSGKITGDKLVEYGDKDGYASTQGKGTLLCYMDSTESRALEWSDPEYNGDGGNIVPIVRASMKNQWGSTPSFLITLSTKGYTSIKFTSLLAGSSNGPAQWKLQYSIDGSNFTDVPSSDITIPYDTRKTMTSYYNGFSMPGEVADKDLVYIRIIASSSLTVAGGNYLQLPFGGETAINGIRVVGTDIASMTTTPQPVTTKEPQTTANPTPQQPVTSTPGNRETKKPADTVNPTTKNSPGNEQQSTTKPSGTGNGGMESTDNGSMESIDSGHTGEVATHIITQTNASGETVTSVVYDDVTEKVTDENTETVTETEKETMEESAGDKEYDDKEKKTSKKKVSTSGNIESETTDKGRNGNGSILIIGVLSAVLVAGIAAAVIIQKKKNGSDGENKG